MKTYIRPLTSVVRIDETLPIAGSIGYAVSDFSGGDDTSGGIIEKTPNDVHNGLDFAKKGMLPFEDN